MEAKLKKLDKTNPHKGHGLLRLFKYLTLQFMEKLSDRELERFIQENNGARWFCGFRLKENTPDHSIFCKTLKKIGTNTLYPKSSLIPEKSTSLMNEVFHFVDATHLITKANLWEERDQAIKKIAVTPANKSNARGLQTHMSQTRSHIWR